MTISTKEAKENDKNISNQAVGDPKALKGLNAASNITLTVLIILLCLVLYVLFYTKDAFVPAYKPGADPPLLTLEKKNGDQNLPSSNVDSSALVTELSFDELEEDELFGDFKRDENLESAQKSSSEAAIAALEEGQLSANQVAIYINILREFSKVLERFYLDQPCAMHLSSLFKHDLDLQIVEMLNLFVEYEDYQKDSVKYVETIFPLNNDFLQKFIRISKISPDVESKELLRNKILKNIDDLNEYFYSKDFQDKILRNQE